MGRSSHHGDRHRRDHERSRSRERRHHHSDDHHHSRTSHGSNESKSKDVSKNIEMVKMHMRIGLGSASAGNSHTHDAEIGIAATSVIETANRQREIERIEEGPFRPAIFQSTAGGAGGRIKTEDTKYQSQAVDRKQDTHEKAIFGPKWRDSMIVKECTTATVATASVSDDSVYLSETKKEVELAGPKFLVDAKVREERWLKLFRERRLHLLT